MAKSARKIAPGSLIARLVEIGAKPLSAGRSSGRDQVTTAIALAERQQGMTMPKALSEILLAVNGSPLKFVWPVTVPAPTPYESVGLDILCGLAQPGSDNIDSQTTGFAGKGPKGYWVFGHDAGGNKFCVATNSEVVRSWDHELSTTDDSSCPGIAASIGDFVKALKSARTTGEAFPAQDLTNLNVPPLRTSGRRRR
jgi:hypothetical protein